MYGLFKYNPEVCLSTPFQPMVDFTIELNEKIFLDPNSFPIDTMLKLLTSFLCNLMINNINKSKTFYIIPNIAIW